MRSFFFATGGIMLLSSTVLALPAYAEGKSVTATANAATTAPKTSTTATLNVTAGSPKASAPKAGNLLGVRVGNKGSSAESTPAMKVTALSKSPGNSGKLVNVSVLNGSATNGRGRAADVQLLNRNGSSNGRTSSVTILGGKSGSSSSNGRTAEVSIGGSGGNGDRGRIAEVSLNRGTGVMVGSGGSGATTRSGGRNSGRPTTTPPTTPPSRHGAGGGSGGTATNPPTANGNGHNHDSRDARMASRDAAKGSGTHTFHLEVTRSRTTQSGRTVSSSRTVDRTK